MAGNKVVMPNSTCDLSDAAGTFYAAPGQAIPRQVGNLQKDKRDTQDIAAILRGRGKEALDYAKLYRIRINLLPGGAIPKVDDKVFVATHKNNPALRGWYTVWDEPEQTSCLLPTQVLSLHKEFM
jgi:hypothetical protein